MQTHQSNRLFKRGTHQYREFCLLFNAFANPTPDSNAGLAIAALQTAQQERSNTLSRIYTAESATPHRAFLFQPDR